MKSETVGKKVAILQSNYIPWKGYFDMIAYVDEFILYDDVQYTRRDWRNRNQIKTPQGLQWLTVPVKAKGNYHQSIREIEIDGNNWAEKHWKSLVLNYKHAPHFEEISKLLTPIYQRNDFTHLSELNYELIKLICLYLKIDTKISHSNDYQIESGKNERLISLCLQSKCTEYISGPSAKNYIDEQTFRENGINVIWFDYDNYPNYPQLWDGFNHHVSILDLLFNCGKDAPMYMKSTRP